MSKGKHMKAKKKKHTARLINVLNKLVEKGIIVKVIIKEEKNVCANRSIKKSKCKS